MGNFFYVGDMNRYGFIIRLQFQGPIERPPGCLIIFEIKVGHPNPMKMLALFFSSRALLKMLMASWLSLFFSAKKPSSWKFITPFHRLQNFFPSP